jgi:hypothetical protein
MGVFRRHRWRRYVEGSHSSLVATDHLAARCIASVNPFSRTNQLPRAHLSANSKRSPTRSHSISNDDIYFRPKPLTTVRSARRRCCQSRKSYPHVAMMQSVALTLLGSELPAGCW